MARPELRKWVKPQTIDDYPTGPCFEAGHLVTDNAAWRVLAPFLDAEKCKKCRRCYIVCPEGSVLESDTGFSIDYRFCKGCGICAAECKFGAIVMRKE